MLRYLHRLAERLSMTVDTLTETMPEGELRYWIACDNLDAIQGDIAQRMGVSVSDLCRTTDNETMFGMIEMERASDGKT